MIRAARILPLVGLLIVLTACPAGPVGFMITVAAAPVPPLPPGGVLSNVVWTGYLVRTHSDPRTGEAWTQTIPLTSTSLYAGIADFSYSDAMPGDNFHIMVQADYWVPNLLDPTHPTVYHVVGQKAWAIQDAMNAGIPFIDTIPVHE